MPQSVLSTGRGIWETGSRDKLIVPGWKERAIERMQRAYAASGKPEHLQIHKFEGGHRWDGAPAVPLGARRVRPRGPLPGPDTHPAGRGLRARRSLSLHLGYPRRGSGSQGPAALVRNDL